MKKALRIIPLIYFIFLAAFWFTDTYISLGVIHYTSLIVGTLLMVQLFHNHKIIGLCYAIVLTCWSGYKLSDVVAGYFQAENRDLAFRFFVLNCSIFGLALLMAALLLYYYVKAIKSEKTIFTSVE